MDDTFDEQLKTMSDEELLASYDRCSGHAGEPACDAYCAEIERRGLDL